MRGLVHRMLALAGTATVAVRGYDRHFCVTFSGACVVFDTTAPGVDLALERLAAAIEATIAAERASLMIAAAAVQPGPLPLWLISGSDILARWLPWAGATNALRKVLTLTDRVEGAPVSGHLDRRARRELGQGGARIRVRGGVAVAERIELTDQPRCVAVLGENALIRIEQHKLPETLIAALQHDARRVTLRPLAEVVSHPFFAAAGLQIAGASNEGPAVVFEIVSRWVPLEPVPATAWAVLPADVDPAFPWRATAGERRQLDMLVDEGRRLAAARAGPR